MRAPPRPGLWLVATREIRFFRRDPAGWFLIVAIPLIAFAVLAWTFSSAVVRGLDVVVVDMDRSAVSAGIVEEIAAAPGLRIAERADNMKAATRAIRSGRAIAAIYIPPSFEQDLLAGRRPQIIAFYNAQYFTPGNIAAKGLSDAISAAAARLSPLHAVRLQPIGSGALNVEQYVLTNPALNYAGFLLRAVMPTTLHVVIAIAACYAVGTEFSRRSRRAWLRCAGDSPLIALVGKLLPLFAVFFVLIAIDALILHAGFALPYRGNILMITVAAALFIAAYLSLAALVQLLVRDLPLGLEPQCDHRLAGLRLCRGWAAGAGDGRLCPRLGGAAAVALVSADPVRPGGAGIAGARLGAAVRDPGRDGARPVRARLAAFAVSDPGAPGERGGVTAGRPQP